MACSITNVRITGRSPDSNGLPTSYELAVEVTECAAIDVEVYTSTGERIFQSLNRTVTGSPVIFTFTPRDSGRRPCKGTYHVLVTCRDNPACSWDKDKAVTIECNDDDPQPPEACATSTTVVVRDSAGVEVDAGQPCVDHGVYTVEVVSPWFPNATAIWSVAPTPSSGGSYVSYTLAGNGRQISYTLPDTLQPPDTDRTFSVTVFGTLPNGTSCASQGIGVLPPVHPTKCPTSITLELRRNGVVLQPTSSDAVTATYANLQPGFYQLAVTDPAGSTYDWFTGGATPAQSGASATFDVDVSAASSPRDVEVFVETGECCPVLRRTAHLTMEGEEIPPKKEPPEVPPVVEFPSWCGFARALLALALVVLFFSILFIVCPSPLMPAALAAAGAAALVAVICLALCLALCGLSFCGFWGIVIWALRWAIVLAIIAAILWFIALFVLALPLVMCVLLGALIYGIICGMLIVWVSGRGCRIPDFMSWP